MISAVIHDEIRTLRARQREVEAVRLVFCLGAGLGVAGLVPVFRSQGTSWQALLVDVL